MSVPCYIYHSFPLEREKQEKEKGNNPSGKNRKLWIAAWGEASIDQQRRGELKETSKSSMTNTSPPPLTLESTKPPSQVSKKKNPTAEIKTPKKSHREVPSLLLLLLLLPPH